MPNQAKPDEPQPHEPQPVDPRDSAEAVISLATDAQGIATLTLTRTHKKNAMSVAMMDAIRSAVAKLAADDAVRVIVLAAEGDTFCAGGDLDWMAEQMLKGRAQRIHEARRLADMLGAINALPKPTIARVQGNAFGGGLGLMAVCDHVVAVPTATFAFTETKLGIIPATIGPYVLARMGEGRARRVFMSARIFGVDEAIDLMLVERAAAADALDAAVDAIAKPYLGVSPTAVARAKALALRLGGGVTDAAITHSIEALADAWETPDAQRLIGAFLASRKK